MDSGRCLVRSHVVMLAGKILVKGQSRYWFNNLFFRANDSKLRYSFSSFNDPRLTLWEDLLVVPVHTLASPFQGETRCDFYKSVDSKFRAE